MTWRTTCSIAREGETSWKALKRAMSEAILVWDTSSVPNGRYFMRVVATDTPSNSPVTALTGAMESTSFDIDNTPPTITVTAVRREASRVTITFEVRDANSSVQKLDYSLDGDRWQTMYRRTALPTRGSSSSSSCSTETPAREA